MEVELGKVHNEPQAEGYFRDIVKGQSRIIDFRGAHSNVAQEITSIDNIMKAKLNNYNLAKGSLVQMQRKKKYVATPRCLLC